MHVVLRNPRSGELKDIKVGFSWTIFLFSGFFGIPFFMRGLYGWGAFFVALWFGNFLVLNWWSGPDSLYVPNCVVWTIICLGIGIWAGVKGNELTAKHLLDKGWEFVAEDLATLLAKGEWGLVVPSLPLDAPQAEPQPHNSAVKRDGPVKEFSRAVIVAGVLALMSALYLVTPLLLPSSSEFPPQRQTAQNTNSDAAPPTDALAEFIAHAVLPTCDNAQGLEDAQQALNKAIAERSLWTARRAGARIYDMPLFEPPFVIELNDVYETQSSGSDVRSCAGTAVLENGKSYKAVYSFKRLGKGHYSIEASLPEFPSETNDQGGSDKAADAPVSADRSFAGYENSDYPSQPIAQPSSPLADSEMDVLRRQLSQCWNFPVGVTDTEKFAVKLQLTMNPDRTVKTAQVLDMGRYHRDQFFRAAADSAIRAVTNPRCNPLPLPSDRYDEWKIIIVNFDPGTFEDNNARKCSLPYPCQLEAVIDETDWPDVRSSIAFASTLGHGAKVHWSNKRNGHRGIVADLGPGSSENCNTYQVTRLSNTNSATLLSCRNDDGSINIK